MTNIIENPDPILKAKWGPLAHVTDIERRRILDSPFGVFKAEVKRIEKQIKELEKAKKRRASELKKLPRFE